MGRQRCALLKPSNVTEILTDEVRNFYFKSACGLSTNWRKWGTEPLILIRGAFLWVLGRVYTFFSFRTFDPLKAVWFGALNQPTPKPKFCHFFEYFKNIVQSNISYCKKRCTTVKQTLVQSAQNSIFWQTIEVLFFRRFNSMVKCTDPFQFINFVDKNNAHILTRT